MKKSVALAVEITAILGIIGGTAGAYQYGRSSSNEEIDYEGFYKDHPYVQTIPDNKIIKGPEQAIGRIENFEGKKMTVGKPWPDGSILITSVVRGEDDLMYLFNVGDYSEKDTKIFFLFNDDINVVRADISQTNFVDEEKDALGDIYNGINDTNYISLPDFKTFAWKYQTDSYAVSTTVVTSVWALENDSELHLIWCNDQCPIWMDYSED